METPLLFIVDGVLVISDPERQSFAGALVSCRRDSLTKSLDFGEDGIGRSRPDEGLGVGVPFGGVPFDPLDQLRYLPKRTAPNRLTGDDTEPDLHLALACLWVA